MKKTQLNLTKLKRNLNTRKNIMSYRGHGNTEAEHFKNQESRREKMLESYYIRQVTNGIGVYGLICFV